MANEQAPMVDPSNTEQAQAWDGDEGEYWAAHAGRFDRAVSRYHTRLMDAAAIDVDGSVLDIGCGTGQTTRDAARRAAQGSALGVDLSSRMLAVARRLALHEGVTNASFERADAQVHPFDVASFDVALSRSGAMFFGDPVAAFTNVARALRPGGHLVLLVWQEAARNAWLGEISRALAAGRVLPPPAVDTPGPLALSDPSRVVRVLTSAGFAQPTFEDLREPMFFGADPDDAFDFVRGLMGWMLEGLDAEGRASALEALRATMRAHQTEEGVAFASGMWLVVAQRT